MNLAGYLPRGKDIPRDLGAAFTVALVSIAEGMAYALVAGVSPVYGLYAGSITVIVGSLFASSTLLIITATNALALVASDKIGALGPGVDPARAMFTLTLLVGVVMLIFGLLRWGKLVRFISAEIQAGLVAAVALLILLGQYKDLVGYTSKVDGSKVRKAIDITAHIGSWNWPTAAIGFSCIAILIVVKRTALRSYADIVALVVGTVAVAALHLDSVETVGDIAPIPSGLSSIPTPHLPDLSLVPSLIAAAVAAAIVGLSEAATVGAAFPNPDGQRSDPSRDFIAQGAANIAGGFFQAVLGGGSLSRTGVNVSAGARTRWAGVASGLILIVVIVAAGELADLIPMTTLAAILIVIGFETLAKEVAHLVRARFISWPHVVAAIITVVVGLFAELTTAIFTGVALSLILFTLTMAGRGRPVALEQVEPGIWREIRLPDTFVAGSTTVISMTGSMYFASAYRAAANFPNFRSEPGAAIVLQIRDRRFYSLTGVDYVADLIRDLHRAGHLVLLADAEPDQRNTFDRTGLLALVGPENVVWREEIIGRAAVHAVQIADRWHAEHHT